MMNRREVFSHFSHILDEMIEHSYFIPTWLQNLCPIEDIEGRIDDLAVPENIAVHVGATRACIVDENYDYVIKFDVSEDGRYGSACEHELDVYSKAKEQGYSRYFAEMDYLGTYTKTVMFYNYRSIEKHIGLFEYGARFENEFENGLDYFGEAYPITISVPLYAYRKAEHTWFRVDDGEEERYLSIARSIDSPMREENLDIAVFFISNYGEKAYYKLSDFLAENQVNDLHFGNVGIIDGEFCFIDYAGYWEFECDEEEEY